MRNMRVRNWVVAGLENAREIATVFLEQKIVQRRKVIFIVHHEFGNVDLAAAHSQACSRLAAACMDGVQAYDLCETSLPSKNRVNCCARVCDDAWLLVVGSVDGVIKCGRRSSGGGGGACFGIGRGGSGLEAAAAAAVSAS